MSVNNIESLCSQRVGYNKKIIKTDTSSLVPEGENYGGEMVKLNLVVQDENSNQSEEIHVVVKKIPPSEIYQEIFNIQHTFRAEINFYEKLVPLFQNFQRENNVQDVLDCFAKFYGSRLNLNGSEEVDLDAAIVFENLSIAGFRNIDRLTGFNFEETQLLLKYLAQLHAVPLAIKIRNPELFKQEIRPHLNNGLHGSGGFEMALPIIEAILNESQKCAPLVPKIQKLWHKFYYEEEDNEAKEPFATFSHGDPWVNNIMVKYANGVATELKFVDFQVYEYASPVADFLYFMFTSVQNNVLKENIDDFLKFYHSSLLQNLKELGCDLEPFGYDRFLKEFEEHTYISLIWVLTFIPFVVFGKKGDDSTVPSFQDIKFSDSLSVEDARKRLPQVVKDKIHFIVEYSARNNWI
ncbi:uncharacterized protein LOC114348095 [Diabrotica virgifera virgifera]|uniref:CHK kinase-like domain-containing protein n=1 Tax=Diabrotica virgifera virgifera TaxID=50390 RepID=A0ABM5IZZ1_DIAVI|nr:uncharacterized protein LOC114348095 [Diabrotica virgifera virgifera]